MFTATIVVAVCTFVGMMASVLFFPTIRIGKCKVGAYWLFCLVGAVVLLCMQAVPATVVWRELTLPSAINPLKIIVLFFSMTFLSVYLDEVGFFRILAKKAVKRAGNSQRKLFILFYILTSVLTVFTSNDVVVLTLTPFICFFCKNTKISPVPFLVGEFAAANTWSMMLLIGNPTNVYLGTSAGLTFTGYFLVMALPTLAAGLTEFFILFLLFGHKLKQPLDPQTDLFEAESKTDIAVGVGVLAVCLAFLVASDFLRVEMWLVSAVCAAALLLYVTIKSIVKRPERKHLKNALIRLPWQLVPFVISMFVIVIALENQGVSGKISSFLGENAVIWTYGASSFLASNLINNIPMSILFGTLTGGLSGSVQTQAVYASIVGSNVGAFLTPIGALAGIMFTELTDKFGVSYGFRRFTTYGALVGIPTLAAALGVLSLMI